MQHAIRRARRRQFKRPLRPTAQRTTTTTTTTRGARRIRRKGPALGEETCRRARRLRWSLLPARRDLRPRDDDGGDRGSSSDSDGDGDGEHGERRRAPTACHRGVHVAELEESAQLARLEGTPAPCSRGGDTAATLTRRGAPRHPDVVDAMADVGALPSCARRSDTLYGFCAAFRNCRCGRGCADLVWPVDAGMRCAASPERLPSLGQARGYREPRPACPRTSRRTWAGAAARRCACTPSC